MKSIVIAEKRVCTKEASEMIVKRRLGMLQLMDGFSLKLRVNAVLSEKNKADVFN